MKRSKSMKIAVLTTLSTMVLPSVANECGYIVCKEIAGGKLQCEDGTYGLTGEKASTLNKETQTTISAYPKNKTATFDSPQVKERINSLVADIKAAGPDLNKVTPGQVLVSILSSKKIESERAMSLIKELTAKPDFDKMLANDIVKHISTSKVMI